MHADRVLAIVREKGSPVQWVMKEIRPQNKQELQEAVKKKQTNNKQLYPTAHLFDAITFC